MPNSSNMYLLYRTMRSLTWIFCKDSRKGRKVGSILRVDPWKHYSQPKIYNIFLGNNCDHKIKIRFSPSAYLLEHFLESLQRIHVNNNGYESRDTCHMFSSSLCISLYYICILLVKTIKHRISLLFFYIIEQKVIPLFMMSSIRMEASKGVTELIDESTKASSVGPTFIIRRRSYSSRYLP